MPNIALLLPLSLLVHINTAQSFSLSYQLVGGGAGVEFFLGTPTQSVYLTPSLNDDEIFVVGHDACTANCTAQNGGRYMYNDHEIFDPYTTNYIAQNGGRYNEYNTSGSSTWRPSRNVTMGDAGASDWWNRRQGEYTLGSELVWLPGMSGGSSTNLSTEVAVLNKHSLDDEFPLQNTLGLGSNSTFLNSLVRNGVIESRSFGLHTLDIDIGGFDESLIVGKRHSSPILQDTGYLGGLQVTVTDMTIHGRSLMNRTSGPFNATLSLGVSTRRPSYVPQVVAEDFFNFTDAEAPTNWSTYNEPVWNTARSSATESFIMVVKLSNGATLNVPSSLLKLPAMDKNYASYISPTGDRMYLNGTSTSTRYQKSNMLGIDMLDAEVKADNPDVEAVFGMLFVSFGTYLYVDWDKQVFELAELSGYSSAGVMQISWRTTWAMAFLSVAFVMV
ncbi:hypothetical protein DFP73DRAFT_564300 [Morchella snyderi]|nr:hypothetical protein DFP73DRAFT_564300 [Morchella snyderi]